MARIGYDLIRPVLRTLDVSGAGRMLAPLFRGEGAVFTFHHVRPARSSGFQPNRLLEITPEFLDDVIKLVVSMGYDLVSLDTAVKRLSEGGRRFVAFTLDDGYRDNRDFAAPIFRRHGCPYTLFVTTEFLDGVGKLWWLGLEESIRRLEAVDFPEGGFSKPLPTGTDAEKQAAYATIYRHLRQVNNAALFAIVHRLCIDAGFKLEDLCAPLCLSWEELEAFADDPLLTLGAHTVSHPFLAKLTEVEAIREMAECKDRLEARFRRSVTAIAYPVGDETAAGPREFEAAKALGFQIGATTRPGLLFRDHARHPMCLPRVSLNGEFQETGFVRELLNGFPFALANRFRRLNVH